MDAIDEIAETQGQEEFDQLEKEEMARQLQHLMQENCRLKYGAPGLCFLTKS